MSTIGAIGNWILRDDHYQTSKRLSWQIIASEFNKFPWGRKALKELFVTDGLHDVKDGSGA